MPGRRLLALGALLALPLAACGDDGPMAAAFGSTSLRDVNWPEVAGRDLNCGQGVKLIGKQFHDITADDRNEAFVVMRCTDGAFQSDQLEVFDGSRPATDKSIGILTRNWTDNNPGAMDLSDACVSFTHDKVVIRGRLRSTGGMKQVVWQWFGGEREFRAVDETGIAAALATTVCFGAG